MDGRDEVKEEMRMAMKARLRFGLVAAAFVAMASSACSQADDSSNAAAPSRTPTSGATGSAPTTIRPEQITAACPLLPATEVVRVLGSDKGTTLQATEGAKETAADGARFTCTYGRDGRQALVLAVAEQAGVPAAGVEAVAQESGATAEDISGLGDAAVTYTAQGFRYVVTAVSYDKGHRLVFVGAAEIVPQAKLTELATTVVQGL
jgi:hypothetical protein